MGVVGPFEVINSSREIKMAHSNHHPWRNSMLELTLKPKVATLDLSEIHSVRYPVSEIAIDDTGFVQHNFTRI